MHAVGHTDVNLIARDQRAISYSHNTHTPTHSYTVT